MEPKEYRKPINPFLAGGVLVGIAFIVLVVISVMNLLRTNPYGNETRIDNIGEFYSGLPQEQKDLIFSELYNVIEMNVAEGAEVPDAGALVRSGTAEYNYDEGTLVYYGNFVVDIEAVRQSYRVQFEWSKKSENKNIGGYPIAIMCLEKDLRIYEDQNCQDAFSGEIDNLMEENPILEQLPIEVDYYTAGYAKRVWYKISYVLDDTEAGFSIVITDYTGGNHQNALDKLTARSVDLEKSSLSIVICLQRCKIIAQNNIYFILSQKLLGKLNVWHNWDTGVCLFCSLLH